MDLLGDPGALVGDRPPELGLADRPPHANEQDGVREQAEKVPLKEILAHPTRSDDVVQIGEDDERQRKGQPAVEIAAVVAVADPEADRAGQRQERKERVGGRELLRDRRAVCRSSPESR